MVVFASACQHGAVQPSLAQSDEAGEAGGQTIHAPTNPAHAQACDAALGDEMGACPSTPADVSSARGPGTPDPSRASVSASANGAEVSVDGDGARGASGGSAASGSTTSDAATAVFTPVSSDLANALLAIEGGRFRDEAGKIHKIAGFQLQGTEVTVAQYEACVRVGRCPERTTTYVHERARDGEYCNFSRADRRNHPMNCVSWQDAADYCQWLGGRLPTEWEWEWAARNGEFASTYPWGSSPPTSNTACWDRYDDSTQSGDGTCEVGAHPDGANESGVLGLAGNVWEWTESWEDASKTSKVLRGGGWSGGAAHALRAAARSSVDPSYRNDRGGFRCAFPAPTKTKP